MTAQVAEAAACLHACQTGCGRPYDILTVQVVDGSTSFFCIPCFMSFAHQIMTAMVEPENPAVVEVLEQTDMSNVAYVDVDAIQFAIAKYAPVPAEDEFSFTGED